MQWLMTLVTTMTLTVAGLVAQAAGDAKTSALLSAARAALGGEKALASTDTLTASGTYRRSVQDRELSGDLRFDLQFPDRMLRTETMNPMGDAVITLEQGVNGDRLIRRSHTTGGGPGLVIRMGGPQGADAEAQAARSQKADFARLALALLVRSTAELPLEYAYGGEAQAEDGKADVVDVKGPGSFAAKLFLDHASHRPLMLTYRGVAPRIVMQTRTVTAGHGGGAPGSGGDPAAAPDLPAPQAVDIAMFFEDYRQVDGLWLPHHVSRSIDGKPSEEWTFTSFRRNPTFKADTFLP